jgi:hypothetical protein
VKAADCISGGTGTGWTRDAADAAGTGRSSSTRSSARDPDKKANPESKWNAITLASGC